LTVAILVAVGGALIAAGIVRNSCERRTEGWDKATASVSMRSWGGTAVVEREDKPGGHAGWQTDEVEAREIP